MKTFVRLSQTSARPGADVVLAAGAGFVTMEGGRGAGEALAALREQTAPGCLMSSAALLAVSDGVENRLVMLQRDANAQPGAGQWQFPAARCRPEELPLAAACRGLGTKVRIAGEIHDWREVRIVVGGPHIEYLTEHAIESFRARYVFVENTFEFYYPMTLRVGSFAQFRLSDREPYGRPVALHSPEQVADLAHAGRLTPAAQAIFEREFAAPNAPAWLLAACPVRQRPLAAPATESAAR